MTAEFPWTPVKVGWISGVSRPRSRALSDEQRQFIEWLPVPDAWKLRTNFPYGAAAESYRPTSLLLASTVNAARFALAVQPQRRRSRVRHWQALKASCDELLLVASSCGSQIAAGLEAAAPHGARLDLLVFGGVDLGARRRTNLRVRGDRDRVARIFSGRSDVVLAGVGHMDYATSPDALEVAEAWIEQRLGKGQR